MLLEFGKSLGKIHFITQWQKNTMQLSCWMLCSSSFLPYTMQNILICSFKIFHFFCFRLRFCKSQKSYKNRQYLVWKPYIVFKDFKNHIDRCSIFLNSLTLNPNIWNFAQRNWLFGMMMRNKPSNMIIKVHFFWHYVLL